MVSSPNGPYLATGKHNFVLKVMGEAIARKLGNALVAPILTLEPGRPGPTGHAWRPEASSCRRKPTAPCLTDMATSLRGMGFANVILMGDSGGNQTAMKEVAAALDAKYQADGKRFYFIPEYYKYAGRPEIDQGQRHPGTNRARLAPARDLDRIHDEYGIDALMALYDPNLNPHRATQEGEQDHDQWRIAFADGQDARDGQEDRRAPGRR